MLREDGNPRPMFQSAQFKSMVVAPPPQALTNVTGVVSMPGGGLSINSGSLVSATLVGSAGLKNASPALPEIPTSKRDAAPVLSVVDSAIRYPRFAEALSLLSKKDLDKSPFTECEGLSNLVSAILSSFIF